MANRKICVVFNREGTPPAAGSFKAAYESLSHAVQDLAVDGHMGHYHFMLTELIGVEDEAREGDTD